MRAFDYLQVTRVDDAVAALGEGTHCLAGGTNLIDLMKGGIEQPRRIVDINRLPLTEVIDTPDGGLRIGALVRNSDLANHPRVRRDYPLLSEALLAGATPQLRNMASVGGNLLQRTRCYYFADTAFPACNKRIAGSGCGARQGHNRIHAILGASEQCVAVHPSDMCVALSALEATVVVRSRQGDRMIEMTRFHRLPGNDPAQDTRLANDELVLAVVLPKPAFGKHVHYLKLRDRASYAFALVSVAVALDVDAGRVRTARIAMGGVAHKPWRAFDAENALAGAALDPVAIERAGRLSTLGAVPLRDNAFKIDLAQRAVSRALQIATERT
jgi:xanthine dehydrogenase YagS FAD-binding subunit